MKLKSLVVVLILLSLAFIAVSYSYFNTLSVSFSPDIPFGYSPPWDVFDSSKVIFHLNDAVDIDGTDILKVGVQHAGAYVYREGYYWDDGKQSWVKFTFPQVPLPNSNWVGENTEFNLDLSTVNITKPNVYVVAYTCKKHNGQWKCGCKTQEDCGYWMYQSYGLISENNSNSTNGGSNSTGSIVSGDMSFKNVSGDEVAFFTRSGDIFLKGTCSESGSCAVLNTSFVISGEKNAVVDEKGNLCVVGGCNNTHQSSCISDGNSLTILNESIPAIVIDSKGQLCTTGTITDINS